MKIWKKEQAAKDDKKITKQERECQEMDIQE